jgi:hypothetical protein
MGILEGLSELEQYPGSKQRVVDWAVNPSALATRSSEIEEMLKTVAKPYLYLPWPHSYSDRVQFYTTGDLGYVLGRSAQTIRNWEQKDAILPEAPCVTTNANKHAKRRLYQHELVVEIYNIAVELGLQGESNKHKGIHATDFTKRCCAIWGKYT